MDPFIAQAVQEFVVENSRSTIIIAGSPEANHVAVLLPQMTEPERLDRINEILDYQSTYDLSDGDRDTQADAEASRDACIAACFR